MKKGEDKKSPTGMEHLLQRYTEMENFKFLCVIRLTTTSWFTKFKCLCAFHKCHNCHFLVCEPLPLIERRLQMYRIFPESFILVSLGSKLVGLFSGKLKKKKNHTTPTEKRSTLFFLSTFL